MHEIRVHEDADEELIASAAYYESCETDLGVDFLAEVENGFEQVRRHPFSWPVLSDNFRRYLLHRFPYAVIYSIEGNQVFVFAVAHTSREPGYWRGRTEVPKFS